MANRRISHSDAELERGRAVFREALVVLTQTGNPFLVGGAFAMFHYTGSWRDTNDLDVYMERKHIEQAVCALLEAGFHEEGERIAGDCEWIRHMVKDGMILDIIWQSPHRLQIVDEKLINDGEPGTFLGQPVVFMSAGELIFAKIFKLNLDQCDWQDVFRIVLARPDGLNWHELLEKMSDHYQVLLSFLVLFDWAFPIDVDAIPTTIREQLWSWYKSRTQSEYSCRNHLLDPWIDVRPDGRPWDRSR